MQRNAMQQFTRAASEQPVTITHIHHPRAVNNQYMYMYVHVHNYVYSGFIHTTLQVFTGLQFAQTSLVWFLNVAVTLLQPQLAAS